ncbi:MULTISPECIES: biotin-dependent carboxyltransferase family protein [unclassified Clostridium]|uniref:5-oxoprolinase subunit C family protein n=1 Tax=unclassified Clostridium TaxID=2614128 RepID=UPI000297E0F4|nr:MULTISPECIES: biotin-dependent carboxyltransferase family protein [unclassified Clostridium]EKQ51665.1 MAG: biotin-dependent carboxylase-like protein [Clostridium sp. Maddingley MBC34-26]
MSITVLNPGLLTTIQDLGRIGYQKYGVIVSGAMDTYSMRLSNIIIGNNENEGVLEITMVGPSLELQKGMLFSITGADISPTINNKPVPMGRPVYLKNDCILKFGPCKIGCRSYLAIAGGFDIPLVMGSKSTYLRAGLGGIEGRALKRDDVLNIGTKNKLSHKIIDKMKEIKSDEDFIATRWYVQGYKGSSNSTIIRVFEDRQYKEISHEGITKFFSEEFSISSKSDRMGYRLEGAKIELKEKLEMISEEVSVGTIQVPPDGNPIILLADRQTAGGYPKIAHVASVDIQKIAQLKPNEKITFNKITLKDAEKLYFQREKYLSDVKKSIKIITI